MTSEDHLSMLITRSYLDSLHEDCDHPSHVTYRTLMAHKAVVVAEREKAEKKAEDPDAWMPIGQCAGCRRNFNPPTKQRGYCASCSF